MKELQNDLTGIKKYAENHKFPESLFKVLLSQHPCVEIISITFGTNILLVNHHIHEYQSFQVSFCTIYGCICYICKLTHTGDGFCTTIIETVYHLMGFLLSSRDEPILHHQQ